jgi:hypothetical protein
VVVVVARRDLLDRRDPKDRRDPRDPKDLVDLLVDLDLLAPLVDLALKDLPALLDPLVLDRVTQNVLPG